MRKILFIEESATLRHALKKQLVADGYAVDARQKFIDGVNELAVTDKPSSYDAIILGWPNTTDPEMDEVLALLSEPHYTGMPLLILAHEADSAKLSWTSGRINTGFLLWSSYNDAVQTLQKILTRQHLEPCCTRDEAAQIKILLVDDSPTARVKFRKLLDSCGYIISTAACAEEAMVLAVKERFDIAIIDYFMPDENGDALCRKLRSNPHTASIIPAVLTSSYLDKVIQDSLAAGAVECMFKNEADSLFKARVAAMSRTIRVRKRIEQERARLEGILSSVGDGVYGVNKDGLINFVNPATLQMLGYSDRVAFIGKHPDELFHLYYAEGNSVTTYDLVLLQQAIQDGRELKGIESIFTRSDGTPFQVELTIYPMHIDGEQDGAVIAFRDVSVRKLLEEELKWQANHDTLTKLLNRKYMEDLLDSEVKRLKRSEEKSALLYIDLDRFKYINDTIGHNAGDQLLIEVGSQLHKRLRHADVLGRLGGDEFGILLRNVKQEDIFDIADEFRDLLSNYEFVRETRTYKIQASIGVALIDEKTLSTGEVLANADIACHIAKGRGRNVTHLFSLEQDEKQAMDIELGWSTRLRQALEEDNFQLYYQPIVALQDLDLTGLPSDTDGEQNLYEYLQENNKDACHSYEVLIRLHNSHGDPISPDAFLPTAERFNLMPDIDQWVINAAMKRMSELGSEHENITFTINLSGQSLEPDVMVPLFKEGIEKYNLKPERFLFEITEQCAINDSSAARALIDELSKMGCRFALDDFGSGYCSFAYLKNLPVDYIKIDGMFIKDILNDPMDMAIVRSITNIAHTLGKQTVAEFVESADILELLKECGVDYIQGYYVSRPMEKLRIGPSEELISIEAAQKAAKTEK